MSVELNDEKIIIRYGTVWYGLKFNLFKTTNEFIYLFMRVCAHATLSFTRLIFFFKSSYHHGHQLNFHIYLRLIAVIL